MALGVCHLLCEAVNILQVLRVTPNATVHSYHNLQYLTTLNLIYVSYTDHKIHRVVKPVAARV
jgi:hypothetical protein